MRQKLEQSCVSLLLSRGIIERKDEEIYLYGISQLIGFVVNIFTSLGIGFIFGMIQESILFSLLYIPLRQYAGGYHAKRREVCFIFSTLLIITALLFMKYIEIMLLSMLVPVLLFNIIIILKAPADSANKRLNNKEKIYFKRKTLQVLGLENLIILISTILNCRMLFECTVLTICFVGMLVFIQTIQIRGR